MSEAAASPPPSYDSIYPNQERVQSVPSSSRPATDRSRLLADRIKDQEHEERVERLRGKCAAAKAVIFLLLVLSTAGGIGVIVLAWPRTQFPCVPYNCTWSIYDQGAPHTSKESSGWCINITDTPGGAGPDRKECVWGVDIGMGQGWYPWGTQCDDSECTLGGYLPGGQPYSNPTTCYRPPPLNPDDDNYCTSYEQPDNWINAPGCEPVFRCTQESALSDGAGYFAVISSSVSGLFFLVLSAVMFVPRDKK